MEGGVSKRILGVIKGGGGRVVVSKKEIVKSLTKKHQSLAGVMAFFEKVSSKDNQGWGDGRSDQEF